MLDLEQLAGTRTAESSVPPRHQAIEAAAPVRLVPYDATADREADKLLPWLWQRMQHDDLVDYYFPGQQQTGFSDFTQLMSGAGKVALFITDDKSGQWSKTIAGFITWQPMAMGMSNAIVAGFIFFREFWDGRLTMEAARLAFEHWFTTYPTNMVLGVCPSLHRAAMIYNKRIGLHESGRLPNAHLYKGTVCDAVLYSMTREQWEASCR